MGFNSGFKGLIGTALPRFAEKTWYRTLHSSASQCVLLLYQVCLDINVSFIQYVQG